MVTSWLFRAWWPEGAASGRLVPRLLDGTHPKGLARDGGVKRDWLSNWRGDVSGGVTSAVKLLTNLARELSHRLRRATRTIYELEG